MIVNLFSVPFMTLAKEGYRALKRCCDRRCTLDERKTKKTTQNMYQEEYLGPELLIDIRYAQVIIL